MTAQEGRVSQTLPEWARPGVGRGARMAQKHRELISLAVTLHASSESARAHCCLTDEQTQNATKLPVEKSVRMRQL